MKIIFYGRERVGLVVFLYLIAKFEGHSLKMVIDKSNSCNINNIADYLNIPKIEFESLKDQDFDVLVSCHGRKIIKNDILIKGVCVNIHPCLFKYKGANLIERYIDNKDTIASVGCHIMTQEVDCGRVIKEVFFTTPIINNCLEFYNIALPYYITCVHKALIEIERGNINE
jgi:methionyl-tRNA formyltransferase